jgi:hypothetical protein
MNHLMLITLGKILRRKLVVILLLAVSVVTAFATLGDGKSGTIKPKRSLLSDRNITPSGNFSLKSGYIFRGSQVINTQNERYINLNTVVTYQKGNATYILPLKKKVMLNKVTFNPNAATRSY